MRNLVAEEHLSAADDDAAMLDVPMPARDHREHMRRKLRRRCRVYLYKAVRPLRFRPRISVAVLVGLAFYGVARLHFEPLRSTLVSFDMASLLLTMACVTIAANTPAKLMPRRAGEEDERKIAVLISGVFVSAIVLGGLLLELKGVKQKSLPEILLASSTIVLAWSLLNMLFAFHYAHEYYRLRKRKPRPLAFPGTGAPDYFDFIYFAFTIGMTFQVTDVEIRASPIRHVAFVHALLSFFFSVMVLGLIVNVLVGVLYFA
jgi:uncharacterized membrane protein